MAECVLAHLIGDYGEDGPEEVSRLDPAVVLAAVRAALATSAQRESAPPTALAEPADTSALDALRAKESP